ncbi:chemotaxis response regulator protein-glutamate methylesterase, partial [Pseudoalteromonas sp. SIMBA_148]
GSPIKLEALEVGAVDFIAKPTTNVREQLSQYASLVQQKVRIAAGARVRSYIKTVVTNELINTHSHFLLNKVIAIGASTW